MRNLLASIVLLLVAANCFGDNREKVYSYPGNWNPYHYEIPYKEKIRKQVSPYKTEADEQRDDRNPYRGVPPYRTPLPPQQGNENPLNVPQ